VGRSEEATLYGCTIVEQQNDHEECLGWDGSLPNLRFTKKEGAEPETAEDLPDVFKKDLSIFPRAC
jgi:hypothetical protein